MSSAVSLWLGPLAAFASSCTWAYGTSVYSALARQHAPVTVNLCRALVALPLFLVGGMVAAGGWTDGLAEFAKLGPQHLGWSLVSMSASYGLGDMSFFMATRGLGVSGALAVASAYPLWTVLGGVLFLGQTPAPLQWFGLFLTLAGVAAVILAGARGKKRPTKSEAEGIAALTSRLENRWVGLGLALVASACWGLNSFAVSRVGQGVSPFVGNAVRMACAIGINLSMAWFLFPKAPKMLPRADLKKHAPVFVIEPFLGSLFFMYGLANSALVVGTTLASLSPVIAVPVAYLTGSEKPSLIRTAGVLLVVLGLYLLM